MQGWRYNIDEMKPQDVYNALIDLEFPKEVAQFFKDKTVNGVKKYLFEDFAKEKLKNPFMGLALIKLLNEIKGTESSYLAFPFNPSDPFSIDGFRLKYHHVKKPESNPATLYEVEYAQFKIDNLSKSKEAFYQTSSTTKQEKIDVDVIDVESEIQALTNNRPSTSTAQLTRNLNSPTVGKSGSLKPEWQFLKCVKQKSFSSNSRCVTPTEKFMQDSTRSLDLINCISPIKAAINSQSIDNTKPSEFTKDNTRPVLKELQSYNTSLNNSNSILQRQSTANISPKINKPLKENKQHHFSSLFKNETLLDFEINPHLPIFSTDVERALHDEKKCYEILPKIAKEIIGYLKSIKIMKINLDQVEILAKMLVSKYGTLNYVLMRKAKNGISSNVNTSIQKPEKMVYEILISNLKKNCNNGFQKHYSNSIANQENGCFRSSNLATTSSFNPNYL